ncbi:MAG: beta-propeller fold lactonase family protein [Saprospiraceae bacterium]|nr:beta-propeller fold lactonase family protein [Saprospiraceae bacterium]
MSQPDSWIQRGDFGGIERYGAAGFSIDGKGYIGTGYTGGLRKNDFWEFDPASNTWAQKADFGGSSRFWTVSFCIGSKGYIGTGFDGTFTKDFWEYDPVSNTWVQKADFGGTARIRASGFSIGNKGYLGTGNDGSTIHENFRRDFWEYDPSSNSWVQKADFGGTARHWASGFTIGDKGYLGTGSNNISGGTEDFWQYDPNSNTWVQKANFAGTISFAAVGFSIGSKGYIGTGAAGVNSNYVRHLWEYDPSLNSWLQRAEFPGTARLWAVGFSIGSKGYIGTGHVGNPSKDFWEYSPCTSNLIFYRDNDNDGYGDLNNTIIACNPPLGYVIDNSDCNDANDEIHPGAQEVCNLIDDNCDGQIDEGVQTVFYQDADGDGYGNLLTTLLACTVPVGYVENSMDCNDTIPSIFPGATEICNGLDDNCDGSVDEGVQNTFYLDSDGDGYGSKADSTLACAAPVGYVGNSSDCNDTNNGIHPGATEICNDLDDNCDGSVDGSVTDVSQPDNQVVCNNEVTLPVGFNGSMAGTQFDWTNNNTAIGLAAIGTGNISSFIATNTTNEPITATVTVIPSPNGNVFAYVANSGSNTVSVINTATDSVTATIPVGSFPFGVSVSPDGSKVYVSNNNSNTVSVINTAGNTLIASIPVGIQPQVLKVTPDGTRVYVGNYSSSTVSVINTTTNAVIATIGLTSCPGIGMSISPDNSKVYVSNYCGDLVSVISTASNTVIATIPVAVVPGASSISPDGSYLYVSCLGSDSVYVINTATNQVVNLIPIYINPLYGSAMSPDGSKIYITNYSSSGGRVINTTNNTSTAFSSEFGGVPIGVSLTPDGAKAYIINHNTNNVTVISTATNAPIATIGVGSSPFTVGNFIQDKTELVCAGTPKTHTYTANPTPIINAVASQMVCNNASTSTIVFSSPTVEVQLHMIGQIITPRLVWLLVVLVI